MPTASVERSYIGPRQVRSFADFKAEDYRDLPAIGIDLREKDLSAMVDSIGMDALQPLALTTATIPAAIQFLQNWLPGFVNSITAARNIDDLVGISTIGAWEDEEVVQGFLELTGTSVPYGDYTNVPLASWNPGYLARTVVRFEEGMRVGTLEEARSARMKINSGDTKRTAAAMALEIQRNSVGFFGYNAGDNLTFGFLNDPNLPAYVVFPNGAAGSPLWSTKTFLEITKDFRMMVAKLRAQGQGIIDPVKMNLTCALATNTVDFFSVMTDQGISVMDWLNRTYPRIRIVSAPELNNANAGQNVAYLYAESISDGSTDDGRVFTQIVPTKFRTIGVQMQIKSYEEDYSNATAGVLVKRPYAIVRFYGN